MSDIKLFCHHPDCGSFPDMIDGKCAGAEVFCIRLGYAKNCRKCEFAEFDD